MTIKGQNVKIEVDSSMFDCVQQTIIQYGILSEDIYNFDETGFAMALHQHRKLLLGHSNLVGDQFYILESGSG